MMEIEDIPNHSFWKNYLFLTSLYCPGYDLSPIGSALQSSMILPRLTPGECQPWGGEEARWLGLGGSFWKPPWGRRHAEEQDMPAPNPRALPTPWQLQAGHRGHPCLPLGKVATLQEEWPGCCPVLLGPWYVLAVSSQEKGFMVEKSTKNVEGVMVTLTAEQNLKLLSSRHGLEGCIQSTMELSKQNSRWVFENPLPGAGHQLQRLRHHPDPAGARGGGLQHAGAVQSDGDGQPGSPATLHQVEQGPGLPVPAAGPATEGFHLCTQDHPAELPTGEAVATCDWEDLRPACWPRLCKAVAEGAHSGKLAPVLILLPGSGSAQDGLPSHQPRIKDAISKRAQCILTGARPCSCQAG
ncbi:epididymal-specific lipocalin-6 isoform X2 [Sciurus carolinensis]|nr:epididymal-specific lipocalin-6 isoform X2 [Sciurus carolinensis]